MSKQISYKFSHLGKNFHIVEKAESLHKIALEHGFSDLNEILKLNQEIIYPNLIYPGERVKLGVTHYCYHDQYE